jgi:hypothetical protein
MEKAITTTAFYSPVERKWIARIIFGCILCTLVYSFMAHTLLHQLQQPVIRYPYVDVTYWLLHWLQIPEFITGHYIVAWIFDAALVITCIMAFLFPAKRLFVIVFLILYFIYYITLNTYGTHHAGNRMGILLIVVPFLVANITGFNYLWQGLRYWLVFGYSCAFFYKLFRLSWLHADQGMLIMKKNLAGYLYFNPDTSLAAFYKWLLSHPQLVNALFTTGFIIEGVFIIGFFTKKFDHLLAALSVLLVTGFWLVADAHFFELLILSATLINFRYQYFVPTGQWFRNVFGGRLFIKRKTNK